MGRKESNQTNKQKQAPKCIRMKMFILGGIPLNIRSESLMSRCKTRFPNVSDETPPQQKVSPTKCQASSGSILFVTLKVFLKECFVKADFGKKINRRQKSMQNYPIGKELKSCMRNELNCIRVHTGKFEYNSRTFQGLLKTILQVFKD